MKKRKPKPNLSVSLRELAEDPVSWFERAAVEPVAVRDSEGDEPNLVMISEAEWREMIAPYLALIPDDHPLVRVHEEVQQQTRCWHGTGLYLPGGFRVLDPTTRLHVAAFRAAVLQTLYDMSLPQMHDEATYNIIYRWFIGEEYLLAHLPSVQEFEALSADLQKEPSICRQLVEAVGHGGREDPQGDVFFISHTRLAFWAERAAA
ncbi:Uncharacterised protein [Bordetella ansorpii]|uniref:Uncharacterized protein n=1 Tax=Bordetella ansorpii TaxID=288768 RepID=A0A157QMW7_9BORD|nr:transposase [Bordetella ansorpii]SAI47121.1 Uncharacterised protein [Bordetella ansorpii]